MKPPTGPVRVSGPGDRVAPFTLLPFGGTRPQTWQPGQVSVLSFCALWCDTWREQSRRLLAIQQHLSGLPIRYRTISVDGRWAERFPSGSAEESVLLDSGGEVSASLGLRAVPWTVVIDAQGVIDWTRQGIIRTDELESRLRRLATERPPLASDSSGDIYLTFDDFPTLPAPDTNHSPDELLLDLLRKHNTHATFFCIAEHLTHRTGASLARRAAREGHRLQMHSWDHDASRPSLSRSASLLQEITGIRPTLYRPPGSTELRTADGTAPASPRRPVVPTYDHSRPGPREITRRVLFATRPGAVIALHAGVADTRAALPDILAGLRNRGFQFAVL
ncbi:MAG: polysaccharide deacetylase family protein [Fibrella sp.]|nr:polysaccharide deacetylase family protein [Armatimonadota bacterium]